MLTLRRAAERGHADFGWLNSHHTFSFGNYHDPEHMGFGPIRVINDDRVAGGGGFPTHPHADMEIVTYVVSGALEHRDSLGTGSVIRRGDVQRMTAGSGIQHSEFNASKTEPVHFLQIWIVPEKRGLEPGYAQISVTDQDKANRLRLVASKNGADGSVKVHQDVALYASALTNGARVSHDVNSGRSAWVQVISGSAKVNDVAVEAGDGVAIQDVATVSIESQANDTELLLFDVAA